jgi:trk system potassium uptake protein TrkA
MYVVVAGAGVVGRGLATRLNEAKHDVVVIDINPDVCEDLYARHGLEAVQGSATDINVLQAAGIGKADVVVGAMRNDADNLALALLAHDFGVPRIIARMTDPQYETALKRAGATHLINLGGFYLDQLMIDIEEPEARRIAAFGGGQGAIVIARVPEGAQVDGWTIERIAQAAEFPDDCVIAGLYREKTNEFIIPRGHRVILAGDQVFLAAAAADVRPALRFLGIKRWKGRG